MIWALIAADVPDELLAGSVLAIGSSVIALLARISRQLGALQTALAVKTAEDHTRDRRLDEHDGQLRDHSHQLQDHDRRLSRAGH